LCFLNSKRLHENETWTHFIGEKLLIMDILRWTIVYTTIYLIFSPLVSSEIHRAKSNSVRNGVKRDRSYVAETESEDSGSDVFGTKTDDNDLAGVFLSRMWNINYETWAYSIAGAALVGLSGIFPLLVIPIEAGPSLRHGGILFPFDQV